MADQNKNTYEAILQELEKRTSEKTEKTIEMKSWDHRNSGNKFAGKILDIVETKVRNGKRVVRYAIVDGVFYEGTERYEGKRRVYLVTVLQSKFNQLGVKVGDTVAVKCLGKSRGGYYLFDVIKK